MAKIIKNIDVTVPNPTAKFKYQCPGCTNVAIRTSNKMLGVGVDCMSCGERIMLDNEKNYTKI